MKKNCKKSVELRGKRNKVDLGVNSFNFFTQSRTKNFFFKFVQNFFGGKT